MADRNKPYRIQTQDGIIVRGIPAGIEPTDEQVVNLVTKARESGDTDVLFPYIQETELARGAIEGGKRVGLNLAEIFGLVEPETVQSFEEEAALQPRSMGRSVGAGGAEILGTAGVGGPVVGGLTRGAAAIPRVGAAMSRIPGALGLTGRGAAEGAIEGAILAGPEERASGARTGAMWGGGMGGAMGLGAYGFRTPEEAPSVLLDMAVDLTPGQMKPQGTMNRLEQAMESLPFFGPIVSGAQRRAQEDFAHSMVSAALPPGAPALRKSDIHSMTREAYRRFEPAYEVAKGYPVYKGWDESLSDIFTRITKHPEILAAPAERKMTNTFLQAQLNRLGKKELVDSGDLLKVRSKIRAKSRDEKLGQRQRLEVAQMLDAADRAITRELTKQLPADVMPYLQRVDRQYAKYKIIEDAAASVKRGTIPTPNQWASAAHKNATEAQRAHGTGMFMPETQAAMETFETVAPRTGARGVTLGGLGILGGGALEPVATAGTLGALTALAGSRTGRQMSVGRHPVQQGVAGLLDQMNPAVASTLGTLARATPVVLNQ